MSLDVWLAADVVRILEGLSLASGSTAAVVYDEDRPVSDEQAVAARYYRQGYTDALAAMAASFGVMPGTVELVQLGAG